MIYNNLHLKAPDNWINDPNGFIWYQGEYHLFYQYFPYEPQWGTMHWGHAVSKDLVHWEHKKIALYPSRYEDKNGCFSGSAIEENGKLYLYYTGVRYEETSKEDIHHCLNEKFQSSQLMITSKDGYYFDNFHDKKVVISSITDTTLGDYTHTRDPKIWKGKDKYYMVLGTTEKKRQGKLLFYSSIDLEHWEFLNSYTEDSGIFGWMCECPDLFQINNQYVLLFSSMGFLKDKMTEENQSLCSLVSFEEKTGTLKRQKEYQYIDYGLDIYACQTTKDQDGNQIMIGWMRMPEPVQEEEKWIGMMSLPRIVEIRNEHICYMAHPLIKAAFEESIEPIKELDANYAYQLILEIEEMEELTIGDYHIWMENKCIHTDRSKVFPRKEGLRTTFQTPKIEGICMLEIYIEPNLIEIFINNGEYVLSNIVYKLGKALKIPSEKSYQIKQKAL